MRKKLRPIAAIVILTILIALLGSAALWVFGAVITPIGALAALAFGHPAGGAILYGVSALIAAAVVYRDRERWARLP